VAAVLGIGLREHHQLDIGGIAPDAGEGVDQVIDLVVRQRQSEAAIGVLQRGTATRHHVDRGQFTRRHVLEQHPRVVQRGHHGFCHAVVQQRQQHRQHLSRQHRTLRIAQAVGHPALDAPQLRETAVSENVRALDDHGEIVPGRGVTSSCTSAATGVSVGVP